AGKKGRPLRGIETMLRIYLLQNWYNLSDEKIEGAIYDSYAIRSFMHINFIDEHAPDAMTGAAFWLFVVLKLPVKTPTWLLLSWPILPEIIFGYVFYKMDKKDVGIDYV
ncbi:MAG: transposase, partial [Cloacibacillus sp.]|nr:transposase [Cloacibacillus sp.]